MKVNIFCIAVIQKKPNLKFVFHTYNSYFIKCIDVPIKLKISKGQ